MRIIGKSNRKFRIDYRVEKNGLGLVKSILCGYAHTHSHPIMYMYKIMIILS